MMGDGPPSATVEIIRNRLASSANEMQRTLMRTAFNTILYEVRDFGISLYDRDRHLIADSPGLSLFLGTNDYSIEKAVTYVGEDALEPGDILFMNYPYWSSRHPNDACLCEPIFVDESLVGYAFVRAHWIDIGAKDPGYVLDSTDVHQEGALFPPVKIHKGGEPDEDLIDVIRYNTRMPQKVLGDLNAQISALKTGVARVTELHEKYGTGVVDSATRKVFDHGEAVVRRTLEELPNGTWRGVEHVDNDGITDEPVRIEVEVTIDDDELIVDFSGSSDAVAGPVNVPIGMTQTICKLCLKCLAAPRTSSNTGLYRPLTVVAPEGCLFHASYPEPTFAVSTAIVGINAIFQALSNGLGEQMAASSGGDICSIIVYGSDDSSGQLYVEANNEGVGWGATHDHDGENALMHISESRVRNVPIEVLEQKVPAVRLERLELRQDSGGPGRYRGGLGVRRDYRFTDSGGALSVVKKSRTPGWGIDGGEAGSRNVVGLSLNEAWEDRVQIVAENDRCTGEPMTKWTGMMRGEFEEGERISNRSGGGGGYGDPFSREPEKVKRDVLDGYVSRTAAREDYGVVITEDGSIDRQATENIRS